MQSETDEQVDHDAVPLSLATMEEIREELGRRLDGYVLIFERPGAVGNVLSNELCCWGSVSARLGLVEYARIRLRTELEEWQRDSMHE